MVAGWGSMTTASRMHAARIDDELGFAYRLSIGAGVLLFVASLCGLLLGARGLYDPDPATLPAFYAQDAMTLVVALPLLVVAMWMTRRGVVAGLLLWSGVMFYIVYMYFFYVVGVRFNALYLVYVALEATSLFALQGLLLHVNPAAIRERVGDRAPVRMIGGFLVAIAVLFATMWIGDVVRRLRAGEPLDPVARLVFAADLTVLLPASATAGILVWRRRPWGYALAGLLLVKVTASGLTLLAGTALALRWDRPVDVAQTLGYVVITAGGLLCTTLFLRATRDPAGGLR
jgi:hypothetical protein